MPSIETHLGLRQPLPLTLYIHIPWCVRKCPYCDFNSHRAGKNIPERDYIDQLIADLKQDLPKAKGRQLSAIFIGGGTPSLLSAQAVGNLLRRVHRLLPFSSQTEITLEANPGTVEQRKFSDFHHAGINRLSIGIQSFQDDKLSALGRIHNAEEAKKAVAIAQNSGIDRLNLDLMHGLPQQSVNDTLYDLQTAIDFAPDHLSWYELTIEPKTVFAKHTPALPTDDSLESIQQAGKALLAQYDYHHYEISAYCHHQSYCQHNLNYWQFGDYLGIGAGAHSKITDTASGDVKRYWKLRNPRDYLAAETDFIAGSERVTPAMLPLEFMMNALRLNDGIDLALFKQRCGLDIDHIASALQQGQTQQLLRVEEERLYTTALGKRFLNDCINLFA
ncbi:MAG: radical SAM family heme chaperone HemW [Pseudomonadota bacterium]